MTIQLDDITRKKLILVRQLFQHAVLQAASAHRYVERIMAVIGFDLTNETILKTIVSALNSNVTVKNEFQGIVQQADSELIGAGLPTIPDRARIQHVRTLRNDAQHKAKYPNENDVSDCRTYTRDFLRQIILNVWGENFESISLIDLINNPTIKGFLVDAEADLAQGEYRNSVTKSIMAFGKTIRQVKESIVGRVPSNINGILITNSSRNPQNSRDILDAFIRVRELALQSVIGLDSNYIRYKRTIIPFVEIFYALDGSHDLVYSDKIPTSQEAEFALEFVTNSIIKIEGLVGDINDPFGL